MAWTSSARSSVCWESNIRFSRPHPRSPMLFCTHATFDLNLLLGDRPSRWVINSVSVLARYDRGGAMDPDGFGLEERGNARTFLQRQRGPTLPDEGGVPRAR